MGSGLFVFSIQELHDCLNGDVVDRSVLLLTKLDEALNRMFLLGLLRDVDRESVIDSFAQLHDYLHYLKAAVPILDMSMVNTSSSKLLTTRNSKGLPGSRSSTLNSKLITFLYLGELARRRWWMPTGLPYRNVTGRLCGSGLGRHDRNG